MGLGAKLVKTVEIPGPVDSYFVKHDFSLGILRRYSPSAALARSPANTLSKA